MTSQPVHERMDAVQADITTLDVDAVVNAANHKLAPGGGVCGAIHKAAGPGLAQECATIGGCPTGEARLTAGHNLPAHYVIHAVGPVYKGRAKDPMLLGSAYRESMKLAHRHDINTIAFPCISTGVFGYPNRDAAEVAVETVREFLAEHAPPQRVIFCCFSDEDLSIYEQLLAQMARAN